MLEVSARELSEVRASSLLIVCFYASADLSPSPKLYYWQKKEQNAAAAERKVVKEKHTATQAALATAEDYRAAFWWRWIHGPDSGRSHTTGPATAEEE